MVARGERAKRAQPPVAMRKEIEPWKGDGNLCRGSVALPGLLVSLDVYQGFRFAFGFASPLATIKRRSAAKDIRSLFLTPFSSPSLATPLLLFFALIPR